MLGLRHPLIYIGLDPSALHLFLSLEKVSSCASGNCSSNFDLFTVIYNRLIKQEVPSYLEFVLPSLDSPIGGPAVTGSSTFSGKVGNELKGKSDRN